MIRVVCGCGRVFQAEDRHTGKRTRCPVCGASLIIGQMPSSGSSEGDLEEVPSWWYSNGSPEAADKDPTRSGGIGDPEVYPTAVLEPSLELRGEPPAGLRDGDRPARAVPPGPRRSTRALGWILAATAGFGALGWLGWSHSPPGDPARRVPPAAPGPREAGRGPRPATAAERTGPPSADDRPSEGRDRDADEARPDRRLHLLVPAYFYPTGDGLLQWRRLFDAAVKVDLVAVVNPASGPGAERNPDYAAIVAEAGERGIKLVGYINTEYAARPASEVKAEVDAWVRFYPRIAGFFLDQQPADTRHAAYIADIATYARGKLKEAFIVTDPGIPCNESYLARRATDLVCVYSHPEGFAAFELPAHLRPYEPSHLAALVSQVADAETMNALLKETIIKRIGWIYITDGKPPNPWGRLPAYWEAEVEAVMRLH